MYVFDCPIHGIETEVFCFRAFDENNIDRWKKMIYTLQELSILEKTTLLESLKEKYGKEN